MNPILIVYFHIFTEISPSGCQHIKKYSTKFTPDIQTELVTVVRIHNNVHTQRQPHWQAISKRVWIVSICRHRRRLSKSGKECERKQKNVAKFKQTQKYIRVP